MGFTPSILLDREGSVFLGFFTLHSFSGGALERLYSLEGFHVNHTFLPGSNLVEITLGPLKLDHGSTVPSLKALKMLYVYETIAYKFVLFALYLR